MNDLPLMGVLHCLKHLQEQLQALRNAQVMCVAIIRERLALNVFHR